MDKEKIIQAGEIAKKVKIFAKELIKKDMPLLEIAEKIEEKIHELGGKVAFPTNLSINEIAAHYTPSHNDTTLAHGLLKVDIGVHIDGWVADTAFSIDLENSEENQKLIQSSKNALENVEKILSNKITTSEIGETVHKTIEQNGFNPIANLSGHKIEQYELHAGISIPNIDDDSEEPLETGLYAIEPFATTGEGWVKNGNPSGIYMITNNQKKIRNPNARKLLDYLTEEYQTLPFCSRWLIKKFGHGVLLTLRQLEQNENLHHYAQLIEYTGGKVSQAENTFLIEKENKVTKTTE